MILENLYIQQQYSKPKKVTTYNEQAGHFLEQLLIVPDLRLHIYYYTYIIEGRGATAGTPAPAMGFCNGSYANHHRPLAGPLALHCGGTSMYT